MFRYSMQRASRIHAGEARGEQFEELIHPDDFTGESRTILSGRVRVL